MLLLLVKYLLSRHLNKRLRGLGKHDLLARNQRVILLGPRYWGLGWWGARCIFPSLLGHQEPNLQLNRILPMGRARGRNRIERQARCSLRGQESPRGVVRPCFGRIRGLIFAYIHWDTCRAYCVVVPHGINRRMNCRTLPHSLARSLSNESTSREQTGVDRWCL